MLVFGKHHEIRRRGEALEIVTVLGLRQCEGIVSRENKICGIGWNWLKKLGIGRQLGGKVFLWFLLWGESQCRFDLLRHQAIGAYLGILKDMGFVEADVEHTSYRALEINWQDKQCIGSELATNVGFDPSVGLRILNMKNLAVRSRRGRDRERGSHSPSDADRAAPGTGAISEVTCIDQSDRDSRGIGDSSRRLHDVTHGAIQAELSGSNRALDFHDIGKASGIDLTFLHRKSVGQKLLKSLVIEAGRDFHTTRITRRIPAFLDAKLIRAVAAYFIAAHPIKKHPVECKCRTEARVRMG